MCWDGSAISHWTVVVLGVSGWGAVSFVLRLVVADFWYAGWSLGAGLTLPLIFFCVRHLDLGGGGGAVLIAANQAMKILVKLLKSGFIA